MAKIVKTDSQGNITYEGLLTAKERVPYDQLVESLKMEIPKVESELKSEYGDAIEYKFYLGKYLATLLEKNEVSIRERRSFWDEIKNLASTEKRMRNEGKNSAKRSFFEQCYLLSKLDYSTVKKMAWKEWSELFDRSDNREDERIYKWIGKSNQKFTTERWHEFEKALHLFLETKDTSVFTDEEMFGIYDGLYMMGGQWCNKLHDFEKKFPKSKKLTKTNKTKYSKKFYALCFEQKRRERKKFADLDYESIFQALMCPHGESS